MTEQLDLKAIQERLEAATDWPWHWVIQDKSKASLGVGVNPGDGDPLVLDVAPCRSCADRAEKWEWNRCTTPSEADATFIAHAPQDIDFLLKSAAAKDKEIKRLERRISQLKQMEAIFERDYPTASSHAFKKVYHNGH